MSFYFRSIYVFCLICVYYFPYFDHDTFTHHALHLQHAPEPTHSYVCLGTHDHLISSWQPHAQLHLFLDVIYGSCTFPPRHYIPSRKILSTRTFDKHFSLGQHPRWAFNICIHGDSIKTKPISLCHIYLILNNIIIKLSRYLDNSTKNMNLTYRNILFNR